MPDAAARVLSAGMADSQDTPRPGTFWFRDWYLPLWQSQGAAVFGRFQQLLADHFPKAPRPDGSAMAYTRSMNWGEYVHFMSGAAGKDLKDAATKAFGWSDEWTQMLQRARADFPGIRY